MIHIAHFHDLSPQQVYEILRLRQDVFILEQNCFYEDIDGQDISALHILYIDSNGQLSGILRILPPDEKRKLSIGRVVVSKHARHRGIGHKMMDAALEECHKNHPGEEILISAQAHLINFYGDFGFQPYGDEYIEAGIPHRKMKRQPRL